MKRRTKYYIIYAMSFISVLFSCTSKKNLNVSVVPDNKTLQPMAYKKWVDNPENGLCLVNQTNHYKCELQYCPLDYMVINKIRKEEITISELSLGRQAFIGYEYFELRLSDSRGKGFFSEQKMPGKESYLLSGLKADLRLVCGKDTIDCVMAEMQMSNGLLPYDLCILAFETDITEKEENITFLYYNEIYFPQKLSLTIKRNNIKTLPKLKTI